MQGLQKWVSSKGAQDEKEEREKEKNPNVFLDVESVSSDAVYKDKWSQKLLKFGVEDRGIQPVPENRRTDTQFSKIFFIWFSWNFNILTFSAGTLGPVVFGLGLRDTCLTILFFNLLCCIPPAYICTWGPKVGMRTMIISRYSFGYYGVIPLCVLNLVTMIGFTIINCILGGQAVASVGSNVSWNIGIVIISVLSLLLSFCGYKVLNWYEKLSWIPVAITYLIVIGLGGKHFLSSPSAAPGVEELAIITTPTTAAAVLSFASTLAGFAVTFSGLATDFSIYYNPRVSPWRIFWYSYIGLLLPFVLLQCLGAAVVVSVSSMPEWAEGYAGGNLGGLFEAMLHPAKGFGKFLTVLFSLSVAGNIASTYYSVSLSMQVFIPWLVRVPRYVLSIASFAIIVPLSIVGATAFYDTLINFLGLIGYWAGAFVAIIILEHLFIRHSSPAEYPLENWNTPEKLPSGLAALGSAICSLGLIIPCMNQVWFVGPIAKYTGDIGFEVAFAVTALLYIPFRRLEIKWQGRV